MLKFTLAVMASDKARLFPFLKKAKELPETTKYDKTGFGSQKSEREREGSA